MNAVVCTRRWLRNVGVGFEADWNKLRVGQISILDKIRDGIVMSLWVYRDLGVLEHFGKSIVSASEVRCTSRRGCKTEKRGAHTTQLLSDERVSVGNRLDGPRQR